MHVLRYALDNYKDESLKSVLGEFKIDLYFKKKESLTFGSKV
jgi:hypothetical protein